MIVCSLEQAVEEHPDLVQQWYGKRLDPAEGKFTAASLAFWTGGAFVSVPKDVKVEKPIQIVYLIDEPGTAQYAQTLAVVGEHAQVSIREYDLGTPFEGQALHAGGFRAVRPPGRRVPRWPTSRTGARPRCTTSRPSGSRWPATRSCRGCRSTWAAG